jgi:Domain of unknown function (DUF5122) beta-propeller
MRLAFRRFGAVIVLVGAVLAAGASPASAALSDTPDSTWMTNGPVRAVIQSGNTIYIGGEFTKVTACPKGEACDSYHAVNVAAIDATTGEGISSFRPDVTNADGTAIVYALAALDGKLFVGGQFTTADGQPRANLAAYDIATGSLDPMQADVTGGTNPAVRTLLAGTSKVYVGGIFKTVDGSRRARLAAIDTDGTLDKAWKPRAQGTVRSLVFDCTSSSIFAGGFFRAASGTGGAFETRDTVARFDPTSGAMSPWRVATGVIPNGVHATDLAATCEGLYVGYGGQNYLYKLDVSDDTADVLWTIRTAGNVQTVAIDGTRVLFGGHFSQINATNQSNVKRTRFAAVNFAGQIDPWKPSFDGKFWGPWDILVTGNQVYVGGDFLTVSGTAQQFLARFTDTP